MKQVRKLLRRYKAKQVALLGWILLTFFYLFRMVAMVAYAPLSIQLHQIRTVNQSLQKENDQLSYQIASASSLRTINKKAQLLGFGERKISYLK